MKGNTFEFKNNSMEIFELSEKPKLIKESINYFWKSWGNENNFKFYQDCIENSLAKKDGLPKFFIGIQDDKIIGSYALLVNDIISRQDLYPWFACLYVNESKRNNGYGEQLLNHGLNESKKLGHDELFLSTDLVNYYERKGWNHFGFGYGLTGDEFKIYSKSTS